MKRILVIGCPGAGKSTFARGLRDRTGLPLCYLDRIWHKPDGTSLSHADFDARLSEILCRDCWIIDGNYLRTLERRLDRCDTVFLLDYPPAVCLAGAASRIGAPREDMPWIEREFDPEFRRWIEEFPRNQLPQIYELLERKRKKLEIFVFHSREEADRFLSSRDMARRAGRITP